jgi:hypothetical protein
MVTTLPSTFTVELWAFRSNGQERNVLIDSDEIANATDEAKLELIFLYGQNDNQPQQMRSVSVGDVAFIFSDGKPQRYVCEDVGWRKLTLAEYVRHTTELRAGKHYFSGGEYL